MPGIDYRSSYEKDADDALLKMGVAFSTMLVGSDCPRFCKDAEEQRDMDKVDVYPRKTHIHGKHYRCTFTRYHFSPLQLSMLGSLQSSEWVTRNYTLADYAREQCVKADPNPLVIEFWNSYQDEEFNWWKSQGGGMSWTNLDSKYWDKFKRDKLKPRRKPTAYDVLACVTKHAPGSFKFFCGDFGYDTDSISAREVYEAVLDEVRKVLRFFNKPGEMEVIQQIA